MVARDPTIVLLTPGVYNSAFYEHIFLAQEIGAELVEGQDLVVKEGMVYMRTTNGLKRVDIVYRRVDDDFLDPAGLSRRLAAGGAGAGTCLQAGQRGPGERTRDGRGGRQECLRLRTGHGAVLPGRGSRFSRTWIRGSVAARRTWSTLWTTSRIWW